MADNLTVTSTAPPVFAPVPTPAPVAAADTITPAQAAAAERARIAGILRCQEAAGRQAAAEALALDSNVDVETARNILRVSPAATPTNRWQPPWLLCLIRKWARAGAVTRIPPTLKPRGCSLLSPRAGAPAE
jgi:hypothetical protein